jgi:predicted alpha/beta-hydrolase family hydrolase
MGFARTWAGQVRGASARRAVLLAAVLTVLGGCAGEDPGSSPQPSPSQPSSSQPSPSQPSPSVGTATYRTVEFTARDGERLTGRLFGRGTTAVVLSHMGSSENSQDDWTTFAEALARRGFQALTYERRLVLSDVWLDVLGAGDFLRANGAQRVVAAGASIGAMASLRAAEQRDNDLNAVLWLAGITGGRHYSFQQADVARVACPLMIISGDQDEFGAADHARTLHAWTPRTSRLLILPSQAHGTEILAESGPSSGQLTKAMIDFITRVSTGPVKTC